MKALLLARYNELTFTDIPDPVCHRDEVIVQVEACGICGSDFHGMDGSSGRRLPPIVMGHEAARVICEIGSGRFGLGDRRSRHVRP